MYARAEVTPLSNQSLKKQFRFLGKVALSAPDGPLRRDTFHQSTLQPHVRRFVRRVGRPRQDWTNEVLKEAWRLLGDRQVTTLLSDKSLDALLRWNLAVDKVV